MSEILAYLADYAVLPIVLICLGLGYILKHYIKKLPNDYIPLILALVGAFLNVWFTGWVFTVEVIFVGIASGLCATGGFELVRNLKNSNDKVLEAEKEEKEADNK